MTLVVNPVGDNPFQPGIDAETYLPDQLIAGDYKIVTDTVTIKQSAALQRGTIMGKITLGAAASVVKGGGNTGTGTFVLDVGTPVLANATAGVYALRCIVANGNAPTFELKGPTGLSLGQYIIAGGAGGSVQISDRIKGVLSDAGVDFIVGDGFDITVAAGSGKYIKAVATALDGSQEPVAILVDYVDATLADQIGGIYQTGEFNGSKLIFDVSFTLAGLTTTLRALSIFIKTALTASDPT